MMLGLTEPTSGSVKVCGVDSTTHPIEVKRIVGYLPEDVGFYDDIEPDRESGIYGSAEWYSEEGCKGKSCSIA